MPQSQPDDTLSRLSVGIDVARICTIFLIVSGHFMQLKGFYGHFTGGAGYPFQQEDYPNFLNSIASQSWWADRCFLIANFSFWSLNFTFFALSGLSLWLSCRVKNTFALGSYFTGRFFSVYISYAIAAATAFGLAITFLGHVPGEHDINYLLLGVTRARETMFYNDTLWFMGVLFVLYIVFPLIPLIYSKTKTLGIVVLWFFSFYYFYGQNVFARESFLPIAFAFFMTGILVSEIIYLLRKLTNKHTITLILFLSILSIYCTWQLYTILYSNIVHLERFEYSTHAVGLLFFILFIALGMQLPLLKSTFLRKAGTATYAVYLFHYLIVRLYNNNTTAYDALSRLGDLSLWPLQQSILVASMAIFTVLMAAALLYDTILISPLIGFARHVFGQEIILTRK